LEEQDMVKVDTRELAEAAALCLRRLAHDLDLLATHTSSGIEATVAESRRESYEALRQLSDALLPGGDDHTHAQNQAAVMSWVKHSDVLCQWAERWDARALTVVPSKSCA
jgi:hypothetical protein